MNTFAFHPQEGRQVDPASFRAPISSEVIFTEDNVRIHGFYIPADGAQRTILFLHGNAGNASHRLPVAVKLWELGANVLLLDYRGYGLSDGHPSEQGIYRDGRAALKYLTEQLGIPLEQVVVLGRSIGSAVAVEISQDLPLAGVILISPMSSGNDVARESGAGWLTSSVGEPFDSRSKIARLKAPLLVFHGNADRVIPQRMGMDLFDAATVPKKFVSMDGAGHNDVIRSNPKLFFSTVKEFLTLHHRQRNERRLSSAAASR